MRGKILLYGQLTFYSCYDRSILQNAQEATEKLKTNYISIDSHTSREHLGLSKYSNRTFAFTRYGIFKGRLILAMLIKIKIRK